ncbi:hypothetical protein IMZ48_47650 [Candidatus Bathyarchaeota archaeon]|nr:hypothetical protein [Candidatus Bathyarchaeota archaeon]
MCIRDSLTEVPRRLTEVPRRLAPVAHRRADAESDVREPPPRRLLDRGPGTPSSVTRWKPFTNRDLQAENEEDFEDVASSTASISASVLEYRTVRGRTYHSSRGNAEYW